MCYIQQLENNILASKTSFKSRPPFKAENLQLICQKH